jgi:hypothetical protein
MACSASSHMGVPFQFGRGRIVGMSCPASSHVGEPFLFGRGQIVGMSCPPRPTWGSGLNPFLDRGIVRRSKRETAKVYR